MDAQTIGRKAVDVEEQNIPEYLLVLKTDYLVKHAFEVEELVVSTLTKWSSLASGIGRVPM